MGGENGELLFNGGRVSIWEDEKVLEMDGVMVVQCECTFMPLNCTLKNG